MLGAMGEGSSANGGGLHTSDNISMAGWVESTVAGGQPVRVTLYDLAIDFVGAALVGWFAGTCGQCMPLITRPLTNPCARFCIHAFLF